jgi:hypothetical protein
MAGTRTGLGLDWDSIRGWDWDWIYGWDWD